MYKSILIKYFETVIYTQLSLSFQDAKWADTSMYRFILIKYFENVNIYIHVYNFCRYFHRRLIYIQINLTHWKKTGCGIPKGPCLKCLTDF